MATRGLPTWPHLHDSPDGLPEPERLILDAGRRWAEPGSAGPMAGAALVLAASGAEGLALLLDPLLRALPGLSFAAPLHPGVAAGEASLLMALAAAQQGSRSLALGLLHRLAPPLGAYRAMPMLLDLARAARGAGLHLAALQR